MTQSKHINCVQFLQLHSWVEFMTIAVANWSHINTIVIKPNASIF